VAATRLTNATDDDRARTFATLLSAFRADPVERWLWPEDAEYEASFPLFLAAFGGEAFLHDTVWQLEDFAAVALWLPPGVEPGGDETRVLMTTVDEARHADTLVALEQMDAAHPTDRHWYLPWFGVQARAQGSGLGGNLMRECLRAVDDTGLPAYLETPNPRTIPFYERHGFRVAGSTRTAQCPVITFMHREPKALA
jgi:GNAT superfamily N-acetyltransferase